jgi:hypothetical protein
MLIAYPRECGPAYRSIHWQNIFGRAVIVVMKPSISGFQAENNRSLERSITSALRCTGSTYADHFISASLTQHHRFDNIHGEEF